MTDTFRLLAQAQPGTSPAALYTVPASTAALVKHIRAVNTDSASRTLELWHGGSAAANVILPTTTILAGGWGEWDGTMTMAAGDVLYAQADAAAKITVTVYGDEVS